MDASVRLPGPPTTRAGAQNPETLSTSKPESNAASPHIRHPAHTVAVHLSAYPWGVSCDRTTRAIQRVGSQTQRLVVFYPWY